MLLGLVIGVVVAAEDEVELVKVEPRESPSRSTAWSSRR